MKVKYLVFILFFVLFLGACSTTSKTYTINLYDSINETTYTFDTHKRYFFNSDLPIPTAKKYDFIGWSYSENGETLLEDKKYSSREVITLYSKWQKKKIDYQKLFLINDIAIINIATSKPIKSKKEYVDGVIGISSSDYNLQSTSAKIRLRGNSSLSAPKKSYKIKFDEKQDLFGMDNDKEWALIANYYDSSLLRNYYAYSLALAMEIPYSVEIKFVDVYLNGVDQGIYLLTETVKTGSNRVDIEIDYDETATEIPFLLELDYKMNQQSDPESNGILNVDYFIYDNYANNNERYPIATKYPKDLTKVSITKNQLSYIKDYIDNVYKSVKTDKYDEYIDIKSVIDYFIVQELFMNIDQDYSSVFMYKPIGEKLKFGPVWDFDISTGNCNYAKNYTTHNKMKDVNGGNYLFYQLMEHPDFHNAYIYYLEQIGEEIIPAMLDSFDDNYEFLSSFVENDNRIWNYLDSRFWPKPNNLVGKTYKQQVEYLKAFLDSHYNWMLLNM